MTRAQRGGIISRLLSLIFLAALIFVLYLARHPLLRLAGGWWVVSDPLQHADVIVVLGDDDYAGDRAAHAAELFQAGWAPQVVASGRMLRPYAGVADLIARDLQAKGVPAAAVVTFAHHADSTRSEAEALRDLVAQRHWHRILLVTSNYHTRRARYIFRKVFPSDVPIMVSSAPDSGYDPNSWWRNRSGLKAFFSESVSYCYAMWELRGVQPAARPSASIVGHGSGTALWSAAPLVSSRSHPATVQLFSVYIRHAMYYISRPGPTGRVSQEGLARPHWRFPCGESKNNPNLPLRPPKLLSVQWLARPKSPIRPMRIAPWPRLRLLPANRPRMLPRSVHA